MKAGGCYSEVLVNSGLIVLMFSCAKSVKGQKHTKEWNNMEPRGFSNFLALWPFQNMFLNPSYPLVDFVDPQKGCEKHCFNQLNTFYLKKSFFMSLTGFSHLSIVLLLVSRRLNIFLEKNILQIKWVLDISEVFSFYDVCYNSFIRVISHHTSS